MAGLQLVFFFLFISLISCTAPPSDLSSETLQRIDKNYRGLAQIAYYKEGQICSGIHIKPWIVLTIADCVVGRELNRLVVGVTKNGSWVDPIQVQVENVTIHDKYKKGVPENNFALLNIYGKMEWEVYEFQFTPHFVTYDEIKKNGTKLMVDKWLLTDENFYLEWKWFSIYKNDSLCGTCNYEDCYCGYYDYNHPEFFKRDVGTPVYYNKGDDKICLGLDTGTVKAIYRVFQEIYSIKTWVTDYVHFHALPPEDKLEKKIGS